MCQTEHQSAKAMFWKDYGLWSECKATVQNALHKWTTLRILTVAGEGFDLPWQFLNEQDRIVGVVHGRLYAGHWRRRWRSVGETGGAWVPRTARPRWRRVAQIEYRVFYPAEGWRRPQTTTRIGKTAGNGGGEDNPTFGATAIASSYSLSNSMTFSSRWNIIFGLLLSSVLWLHRQR